MKISLKLFSFITAFLLFSAIFATYSSAFHRSYYDTTTTREAYSFIKVK